MISLTQNVGFPLPCVSLDKSDVFWDLYIVTTDPADDSRALEQPFPLRTRFRRRFVPAFVGFIAGLLFLIGFTAQQVIEEIYLELAQRRAQTIARAVESHEPAAWRDLTTGQAATLIKDSPRRKALMKAFGDEVREQKLDELKVYSLDRIVLFATHEAEIGSTENGDALRQVIKKSTSKLVSKTLDDQTRQYELYVPVFDKGGDLRTVFELYEPVGYLDEILTEAALPILLIPGFLLLLLALGLSRLVNSAQIDIDLRTAALNDLRRRIESFVSATAVNAARSADQSGGIQSQSITTTLFFSDIRDFTGFAEQNPPEVVVDFLNQLMTLQVDAVKRHGGDVDKMIGDAVLARFDGAGGSTNALAAARDILQAVAQGDYPRALGIGIYRGEVISGAIGPEDRRDFTVIGDAVNVAARLCSAAMVGEIVIDDALADDGFGAVEQIQVKGRQQPLAVRRWKV